MAVLLFWVLVGMGTEGAYGQPYSTYSNDSLVIQSEYLQEAIRLNLHLPETLPYSAGSTQYPIAIVFDSQHERTYPQIIRSFDLLTSETQIPENIIVGVPFNSRNRRYFTSDLKREGDSLSGIQRMELFLFSELIPKLQKEFKGNEFLSILGHSRTGFLVNYLAYKNASQVNIAVSLSGFFNDSPLSSDSFSSFLTDSGNFPGKFSYYYTAGTTREESTYLSQFSRLDSSLATRSVPENVKITFRETPNANHITNYWVSLPPILMEAFSAYNSILDRWLHDTLNSGDGRVEVGDFESDLREAGKEIGVALNPGLTHIYSLASHFAYSEKDYERAADFMELGLAYYPDYLGLYMETIDFYKALNNGERVGQLKRDLREKADRSVHLSASERMEIRDYLEGN